VAPLMTTTRRGRPSGRAPVDAGRDSPRFTTVEASSAASLVNLRRLVQYAEMTASSPWLTIHCRLMLIPAGSLLKRHARPVLRLLRFVYLSICQNVTYNIHSKFHNATGCYRHDREADLPHLFISAL